MISGPCSEAGRLGGRRSTVHGSVLCFAPRPGDAAGHDSQTNKLACQLQASSAARYGSRGRPGAARAGRAIPAVALALGRPITGESLDRQPSAAELSHADELFTVVLPAAAINDHDSPHELSPRRSRRSAEAVDRVDRRARSADGAGLSEAAVAVNVRKGQSGQGVVPCKCC